MSVHEELTAFKKTREVLKEKLEKICSTLHDLYAKKEPLEKNDKALSERTSSLAQDLLEKVKEELEKVNQEIVQAKKEQEEIKKELDDVEQNIFDREEKVELYVDEQSSIMVSEFLAYIERHKEDIGLKIKKTFSVIGEKSEYRSRYGKGYAPTGNIGVFDESNESFIVKSEDFYFENELYTAFYDSYDIIICTETKWYEDYRDYFISHFLEVLKKSYTYGEFFKLTIENPYITLELV